MRFPERDRVGTVHSQIPIRMLAAEDLLAHRQPSGLCPVSWLPAHLAGTHFPEAEWMSGNLIATFFLWVLRADLQKGRASHQDIRS